MTGPLILKDNPAEDLEAATKQYVDNHTSDVVLYTPQTLSDEQKVQARGNIGAAPDGFGLGEDVPSSAKNNDANTITKTGWFMASINTPTNGWWIIYSATYGDTMYQFAYANEGASSMLMGTVLQRSKKTANVDWTPWEYINPPMKLGVEYRTTERYLSKPVYCQVIDCGVITANTQKEIIKSIPVLDVLSCEGVIHTNSNGHNQATPFDYQLTDGTKYSVTVSAEAYKQSEADILYIYVNSSWAVTGSVCAIVRYTKETDQ